MEFRREFTPEPFDVKIKHTDRIMLIGSCFTEQMGSKLARVKFLTHENPNGILFNPASIIKSIDSYLDEKVYRSDDLFEHNGIWGSWDHHTRFSDVNQDEALRKINSARENATAFIKQTDWLILTLGSAFLYEHNNGSFVANCHKVPTDRFVKRLMTCDEITSNVNDLILRLKKVNPKLKVLFTISPVRHLREGFVENNRSKSMLIQSVHQLTEMHNDVHYFPAYELVIDDLRDYRFYAEDMVHPNYQATEYVWEKFQQACLSLEDQALIKEIHQLVLAKNHRPFNPTSDQHKSFLLKCAEKAQKLMSLHPHINLHEELLFFTNN
jgi:lysophospholipase L1-like esterase